MKENPFSGFSVHQRKMHLSVIYGIIRPSTSFFTPFTTFLLHNFALLYEAQLCNNDDNEYRYATTIDAHYVSRFAVEEVV